MPGSEHGIPDWAPTIADLVKDHGYATGQFGKNHLGDQDKHLPTNSVRCLWCPEVGVTSCDKNWPEKGKK